MRFLTAGESHGPSLTAILEGIPAGLSLRLENINRDLARRQQGYGRGGRMKIETDTVRILSGVRFGETLGSPITLSVENRDWQNWQERMAAFGEAHGEKVTAARPGHADLTGVRKYAREDIRDILERASARETAMRVAVGAVAKDVAVALGRTGPGLQGGADGGAELGRGGVGGNGAAITGTAVADLHGPLLGQVPADDKRVGQAEELGVGELHAGGDLAAVVVEDLDAVGVQG